VPSAALPYSDPFGTGSRPYLALTLTGIHGTSSTVVGLLDTGADTTALPVAHAKFLGYELDLLRQTTIGTADGTGVAFRAARPSTAIVPGLESVQISVCPIFVPGAQTPLWGRKDVMRPFKILFDEAGRSFTLEW
jgi:hypothetical protein